MELDLDKARAARASEDHSLTFGGVTFTLPAEMSLDAGDLFAAGDIRGGLVSLLDAQSDKFFELGPSVNDLLALVNGQDLPDGTRVPGLMDIYVPGTSAGESSASSPSSTKGSKKSRPPSNANTAST